MKDIISVQFWELDAFLTKEIDLRLMEWQSTSVIYSSEMSFVRPGRATATGGMGCMGASLFQPTLMNFEVL